MNRRCQEETVQVPEVRDQEQEEVCAVAVWAQVAAQDLVEVWELAVVVWAGWAELALGQDQADNVSVHHVALQQRTGSALRVTRWRVRAVELRWRESEMEKSEKVATLSILVNITLLAIKYTVVVSAETMNEALAEQGVILEEGIHADNYTGREYCEQARSVG